VDDEKYETNSDVGQITMEDFEMMRDIINRSSDDKDSLEEKKSESELISLQKMGEGPDNSPDQKSASPPYHHKPGAESSFHGVASAISPGYKKSLKANRRRLMKSNSAYLKAVTNDQS